MKFRFIQRSLDLESTILQLIFYSKDFSDGYLNDKELEKFIYDAIPDMGPRGMPESFYPFYVFTSARRFFFFLDPRRRRKLNINKLAHSTLMEEFLFIKRLAKYEKEMPPEIVKSQMANNWFSPDSAKAIYTSYVSLDKDRNGIKYTSI
jgi:hypothetical protein